MALAVLMPGWASGVEVCRELLQAGVPLEVLRLSDPAESSFGTTLVSLSPLAARVSRALFSLRRYRQGCLLLLGWAGRRAGGDAGPASRRAGVARGGRARPRAVRLAAMAGRALPPPVPAGRAALRGVGRGHAGDRGALGDAGDGLLGGA